MSKEQQSFYPDEKTKAIIKEKRQTGETISHFINAAIAYYTDIPPKEDGEVYKATDEQTMIIQNMLSIQMEEFKKALNESNQITTKVVRSI